MSLKEKVSGKDDKQRDFASESYLILHNDNINSFEFVIECLVGLVNHDPYQAEQCAYLTHYKGQCDIKKGRKKELSYIRKRLMEKNLTVTIQN